MRDNRNGNIKIVIFAESQTDRDQLRSQMAISGATFLYFEKETICFDNLKSLKPDIVVVRTDSKDAVWRFLFAAHILKLAINMIVVSEVLEPQNDSFAGQRGVCFPCEITWRQYAGQINETLRALIQNGPDTADFHFDPLFVGQSTVIKKIRSVLPNLKKANAPILISGEQGTGKELLARFFAGPTDSNQLFIKLDCAALSRNGIGEPPFFNLDYKNKGPASITFLLDGIDKANSQVQSEVLMLLDGPRKTSPQKESLKLITKRFISTTSSELEQLTRQGRFRQDLFYRLNVIPIEIPPLRKRKEDIPLLADFFMLQIRRQLTRSFMIASDELKQRLHLYHWPGNVDELQNLMHQIAVAGDESIVYHNRFLPKPAKTFTESLIQVSRLEMLPDVNEIKSELKNLKNTPLKAICDKFISQTEKKLMQRALESTNWNRKKAAALLNISYKSMLNKMKIYEIG